MSSFTKKIVDAHDAATNLTLQTLRWKPALQGSIAVEWDGIEGDLDGVVNLYKINSGVKFDKISVDVASASNVGDSDHVEVYGAFEELGFEYVANGNSGESAVLTIAIQKDEA